MSEVPDGGTMIHEKISAYFGEVAGDPHHRYRSWEHCYRFFREMTPSGIAAQRENAALQLGFYLASWGMYRGSAFLLQRAYTVHLGVVDCLTSPHFAPLWVREFGCNADDVELVPVILEAAKEIRKAYSQFGKPTELLVTKVVLGTFGCLRGQVFYQMGHLGRVDRLASLCLVYRYFPDCKHSIAPCVGEHLQPTHDRHLLCLAHCRCGSGGAGRKVLPPS
jgi:hypothetical protein